MNIPHPIFPGQADSGACVSCTPGWYCGASGLSEPTGECDPGWYCTLGSSLQQPTDPEGGKCLAGTYCPQGSSAPLGCDEGSYCETDMLSAVTGNCTAGYYCTGNSTTGQPTGTGGKCFVINPGWNLNTFESNQFQSTHSSKIGS